MKNCIDKLLELLPAEYKTADFYLKFYNFCVNSEKYKGYIKTIYRYIPIELITYQMSIDTLNSYKFLPESFNWEQWPKKLITVD